MDRRLLLGLYNFTRRNKLFGGLIRILYKGAAPVFALIYCAGAIYAVYLGFHTLVPYVLVPLCVLLLNLFIRKTVKRQRPCLVLGLESPERDKKSCSFPSNHSSSAGIIAFALMTLNTVFGAAALCLALLTGLSRVAVGVHYPSDILAGFVLSAAGAVLGFVVLGIG